MIERHCIIRKLELSRKLSSEQIVLVYHDLERHDELFLYAEKVIQRI